MAALGSAPAANGDMIQALLAAGADPNAAIGQGETPLMTAARTGTITGVRALLERGANVNAKESYRGQTALMGAVAENHAQAPNVLLDRGAEVNARSAVLDFNFRN